MKWMNCWKSCLLVILCWAGGTIEHLNAQSFPKERDKFVKELQRLTAATAPEEDMSFMKKELVSSVVTTKAVSDEYFDKMVETANLMETKKMRYYPDIYQYVYSVHSFVKNNQGQESYKAWHGTLDKLLAAKNVNRAKDYIEFSAGFFSDRTLVANNNFKWKYTGGNYTFFYVDEKPYINFSGGNLGCYLDNRARNQADFKVLDSIFVEGCSGTFYPLEKEWKGKGGKVTWERVGLDKSKTYATLNSYAVNMKIPSMKVDTATLTTPYFSKPVSGALNEKAYNINREADKIFPQFTSFDKNLKIKNLFENVDYSGGYSLQGPSVTGVGTDKQPAKITIYKAGKTFTTVQSQTIIFNEKSISSASASVALKLGDKDSLYHPGLAFSYDAVGKKIEMTRDKAGLSQAPFVSSYHNLEIHTPKITWSTTDNFLDLTYGPEIGEDLRITRLESRNFFDGRLYEQLQGMESVHPLVALYRYCYKYDEFIINEGKFATALGKTIDQAKPILLQMSTLGFVDYNPDTKVVVVNEKTKNYLEAKSGKQDFDNLTFISDLRVKQLSTEYSQEQMEKDPKLKQQYEFLKKKNEDRKRVRSFGKIDLSSMNINLIAVDKVEISDANKTAVFPDNAELVIKKDRNFEFKGWVNSGKLEVKTRKADYDYASNTIHLLETESGFFNVFPLSEKDGNRPIAMQSVLNELVGAIKVDDPKNRAGNNKNITGYPKLVVSKESRVYYNHPSIYKGAYDSTRFYFTVTPFERDSLTNFNDKTLRLKGNLTSAGIFPKFDEELKIMPDYSFGFSKVVPKEGYNFYTDKAKYNNKIVLSNNGLQGAGKIDFLQSSSESNKFTFLPDSTIGYARFINKPLETGVQFPDVNSEKAFITYLPKGDMLKAGSTDVPLEFFNKEAMLTGVAVITSKGMTGNGILALKDADLQSGAFSFKRWDAHSDYAKFSLKNNYKEDGEDPLAFKTDNVTADVSFKERKGTFKSNKGESKVEFPVNQYYCKIDFFTWLMDKESVQLHQQGKPKPDTQGILAANFYSTHPKQDSLQFRSPTSNFSLKEKTIFCDSVEYIRVADAQIYPDSMKVVIRKKAEMDELKNASILASYTTKYHRFFNANTKISARNQYTSAGKYKYIDADSTVTIITMTSIAPDAAKQTVAKGKIENTENFKLNKQFDYYGDVQVNAGDKLITFNGATRINHGCDHFPKSWMAFNAPIDPKNIQIPVTADMKTLEGLPVSAGIVWRNSKVADSVRLYPTFLSTLEDPKDPIVITAEGFLQYDFKAKEYQIASKAKLANRNEKGNFIALHTESCSLNGDGRINLGMDYGDVSVDAVGVVNYNQSSGKTDMNITARYNLPVMDKASIEKAAAKITDNAGLKPLDMNSSTLIQAITEWKDAKAAEAVKTEFTQKGDVKKLPKELDGSIIITGLRLSSYNNPSLQTSGLITTTDFASVVSIYDKVVFRQVPLKAFFKQVHPDATTGDKFDLYISNPGGADYLFDYGYNNKKEGLLQIYSNDSDFESALSSLKEDKRKTKNFKYELTPNSGLLSIFMRLFE